MRVSLIISALVVSSAALRHSLHEFRQDDQGMGLSIKRQDEHSGGDNQPADPNHDPNTAHDDPNLHGGNPSTPTDPNHNSNSGGNDNTSHGNQPSTPTDPNHDPNTAGDDPELHGGSATNKTTTANPVANNTTTTNPAANNTTTANPATNNTTTANPATNNTATINPTANNTTTTSPPANNTTNPATNNSTKVDNSSPVTDACASVCTKSSDVYKSCHEKPDALGCFCTDQNLSTLLQCASCRQANAGGDQGAKDTANVLVDQYGSLSDQCKKRGSKVPPPNGITITTTITVNPSKVTPPPGIVIVNKSGGSNSGSNSGTCNCKCK